MTHSVINLIAEAMPSPKTCYTLIIKARDLLRHCDVSSHHHTNSLKKFLYILTNL